jgi:hypothetical protein
MEPRYRIVAVVASAVIAALVLTTYGVSAIHGRWPPSHPWSGLSLTLIAVSLLAGGLATGPRWVAVRVIAGILGTLAAAAWLVSAAMA